MLKKFFSGAIFGAGFSIVTLCLYTVWMFYMLPSLIDKNMSSEIVLTENPNPIQNFTNTQNFDELSVDEKIELATAIIIVKFEEDKNGNYKGEPQKEKANEARRRIYLEFKVEPPFKPKVEGEDYTKYFNAEKGDAIGDTYIPRQN